MTIPRFSPSMAWLLDMIALMEGSVITIPPDYRTQVLAVKALMANDESGIISSLLDFGISSASDVNLTVETDNAALSELLNNWLDDINGELLGKIPIGIEALSKEYYRERWKGSSLLLLRTVWQDVDGIRLPVKMWFVDGEDVHVTTGDQRVVTLGDEKYSIIIDKKDKRKNIKLPTSRNEKIFVQKPFTSWGMKYPMPFLIQRGLYKNALFLKNLIGKGEVVVAKALEYLMVVKKGTEALAKESRSEFIYSDEDLKAVKEKFGLLVNTRHTSGGVPSYITNFDTDIEHLIPEYERILKPALFVPIEQRILSGLGLIDVVDSANTSRREGTLNPKAYIGELNSGINDFKALIKDILLAIVIENKGRHPKYFSSKNSIDIRSTPVKAFMTDDYKSMLRSLYDRGVMSKKTFVEVVGETSYGQERDRRIKETADGDDILLYPPVIQNQEQFQNPDHQEDDVTTIEDEDKLEDRTGPEAKNFASASEDMESGKVYDEAPYNKTKDLPKNVTNVMSSTLQKVWMEVFNKAYPNGEDYARKTAWSVIKKIAEKNKDGKWVKKKSKASLKTAVKEAVTDLEYEPKDKATLEDVYTIKKIEFLEKKRELLNKLLSKEDK